MMPIIFLGPSLSLEEAQAILPARYYPPARQGDILSLAVQYKPKVIGLIDGYFTQTLSVWHKEILYALDQGIQVVGASSMGALRAAETDRYGMIGVGKVYEAYRDGVVTDDDEVALIHGPKEEGYIPFSLPLINLRFTMEACRGKIPKGLLEHLFQIAKSLYYPGRTFENFKKKVSTDEALQAIECLELHYIDQKREDAKLLLRTIKVSVPEPPEPCERRTQTPLFDILYHSDRRLFSETVDFPQRQIALYTALHHPEFQELQFQAFNQGLANFLAKVFEIEVGEEEVQTEKKRFLARHAISDLNEWLSLNHLTEQDFNRLVREKTKTRKLHRSLLTSQVPWKQTRFLIEELKWSNQYRDWYEKALCQEELLQEASPFLSEPGQQELRDPISHCPQTLDLLDQDLVEEAGFLSLFELKEEVSRASLAKEYLQQILFN